MPLYYQLFIFSVYPFDLLEKNDEALPLSEE